MTTLSKQQEKGDEAPEKSAALGVVASVLASLLTVAMAIAGHLVMAQRRYPLWGAALFGLAVVIFLAPPLRAGARHLAQDREAARDRDEVRLLVRQPLLRWALLLNSLALAGLAYWLFHGNRLDRGFWLWIVALLYFAASQLERPARGWWDALRAWWRGINWPTVVVLSAIVGLALFFRVFRLSEAPVEMT
ncbi:MAG: hypothetical protein ACOC9E_04220, partial [Chloroflexota bacterium]